MEPQINSYRKMLAVAVSGLLMETGFDTVDKDALGTLTEMVQAFLCELGLTAKNFCELNGRCEPLIADIIVAFVDMGFNFSNLENYIKTGKHTVLPPMQPQQPTKSYNMLSAGTKLPLPPYIPQHLPAFPDPHAYIRTPTHKQPIIDYESVREKAAVQKRDIEKALTKFLAKTSPTHSLFDTDEVNIFSLIACKPSFPPYLSALMPQDQIFDAEDLEFDPKSQIQQQQKDHDKAKAKQLKQEQKQDEEEEQDSQNEGDSSKNEESTNANIDNPYLAATKLPNRDTVINVT